MNARLEQRLKKLEGGAGMGADMPRFILVRGIATTKQKEVVTSITCNDETVFLQPGESEDAFIGRAEGYFEDRIKPNCVGLILARSKPASEV